MKKEVLLIFLVLTSFLQVISAQYISGDIYLRDDGTTKFDIQTDKDLGIKGIEFKDNKLIGETSELISKSKEVWSFNLKDNSEGYENILVDIHFPSNVERVIYLKGNSHVLDLDNKIISLIDNNNQLNFGVEYTTKTEIDYTFVWIFILIILIVIISTIFTKKSNKRKMEDVFPFINDQEKAILELLMKKSMRQKDVRKILNFPKASFSRYIVNLEKKKLIFREGEGKNKVLRLK